MSTEPLLSVRNLRIGFGSPRAETQVVHGVSFDLYRGEAVAIVGESGSGKSVTARSLIGLAGPTARVRASRLAFHGADLLRQSERDWQGIRGNRIGFVLQDALVSLDPLRSVGSEVEEVLARHTDLNRAQRRSAAIDALGRAGIPDPELRATQLPGQLSGGLRQRALIASAIAADPDLVIADEPTTALDVTVQAQVLDLLREQVDAGRSLLLISHDLAVVSRVADRVIVVQHGRIVEEGPAEQVLTAPSHSYTKQLLQAVPSVHSKGTRLSNEPRPAYIERIARPDSELGSPVVLRGDGLVKSFASAGAPRVAVSDVTFTLRRGETLGVVGESGSGKSTLARMALGLERPDRGSVEVGGRRWADLRGRDLRSARLNIQAISQDALGTFDPRHTVGASLREALGASGVRGRAELRSRSVELLRLVGLTEAHLDRRPLSLSGGQRQRVAIARALAPRPDILVCDEPVSSLDVSLQAQVLDLLADVQAATGVALLFISHDLGVIYHVSDRVLVMRDGCAVEEGTVAEVFANPRHPYTRELIAAIPRPEPLRLH